MDIPIVEHDVVLRITGAPGANMTVPATEHQVTGVLHFCDGGNASEVFAFALRCVRDVLHTVGYTTEYVDRLVARYGALPLRWGGGESAVTSEGLTTLYRRLERDNTDGPVCFDLALPPVLGFSPIVEFPAATQALEPPAGGAAAHFGGSLLLRLLHESLPRSSFCLVARVHHAMARGNVANIELQQLDRDVGLAVGPGDHKAVYITCVCFDGAVSERLVALCAKHAVVRIRNATVKRKTERDKQYERNDHRGIVTIDASTDVCVLHRPTPVELQAAALNLSVAAPVAQGPVVSIGSAGTPVTAVRTAPAVGLTARDRDLAAARVLEAARRRTEQLELAQRAGSLVSAGTASTAASSGSASSVQSRFSRPATITRFVPAGRQAPPVVSQGDADSANITRADIARRDGLLQQERAEATVAAAVVARTVSQECFLCGIDSTDEAALHALRATIVSRVSEQFKPKVAAATTRRLQLLFCDQRLENPLRRMYCRRPVQHIDGRLYRVHVRCAHLATKVQLERGAFSAAKRDVGQCCLCRLPGATVKCYHPECNRWVHVACGLLTGFLDLGRFDPVGPCPACPTHRYIPPPDLPGSKRRRSGDGDDEVLFDSGRGGPELFDPDEHTTALYLE